jgi:hypothetical protein
MNLENKEIKNFTFCQYCKGPNDRIHINFSYCNKCLNDSVNKTIELQKIREKYNIGQFGKVKENEWYNMMIKQYLS